jgi:hypothetical protein
VSSADGKPVRALVRSPNDGASVRRANTRDLQIILHSQHAAVENVATVHDLHATMLHQLGIDSNSFTVKFQGLDAKLTGVEGGHVIRPLLAWLSCLGCTTVSNESFLVTACFV